MNVGRSTSRRHRDDLNTGRHATGTVGVAVLLGTMLLLIGIWAMPAGAQDGSSGVDRAAEWADEQADATPGAEASESELSGAASVIGSLTSLIPSIPTPTSEPTSTPEPTITPAPEPTATPTLTPEPTATSTSEPTSTPEPTLTPTPEPTLTPTPEPTLTPTPEPTLTPTATATPEPINTPTPEPTSTPADNLLGPPGSLATDASAAIVETLNGSIRLTLITLDGQDIPATTTICVGGTCMTVGEMATTRFGVVAIPSGTTFLLAAPAGDVTLAVTDAGPYVDSVGDAVVLPGVEMNAAMVLWSLPAPGEALPVPPIQGDLVTGLDLLFPIVWQADASYDAASGDSTSVAAFPIAGVGPLEEVTVDPFYLLLAAGLLLAWAVRTRRWGVHRW